MDINPRFISIHHKWFDRRSDVQKFNEKVKRFDKAVYCAYDYDDGFYKVYKKLPFKVWGELGDFDGKGFHLYTIKTPAGNPRLPHENDIDTLRKMEIKRQSLAVQRNSDLVKKFWL